MKFKRQLSIPHDPIVANQVKTGNTKIDCYGETVVTKLKRPYQIEFTEKKIHKIITAYQAGKTAKEISNEYGCCRTTICKLLRQHGVNVTKAKARQKIDEAETISLYENKHTIAEIAAYFGVNPQVITKCLRDHNVPIRGRWDYR